MLQVHRGGADSPVSIPDLQEHSVWNRAECVSKSQAQTNHTASHRWCKMLSCMKSRHPNKLLQSDFVLSGPIRFSDVRNILIATAVLDDFRCSNTGQKAD